MKTNEITCINKIHSNEKIDTFEYRDMYNDVKTIEFPKKWEMNDEDIERYLTNIKTL